MMVRMTRRVSKKDEVVCMSIVSDFVFYFC